MIPLLSPSCYPTPVDPLVVQAFRDELEKIAISRGRLNVVAQERKGTRPISVDKLLKKEKDGTLVKGTGNETKVAFAGSSVPFSAGAADPAEARIAKKKGEVPSKEDMDVPSREDGRGNAATTMGQGQTFNNIAATGNSAAGT